jgi:hypothetical protein
MSLFLFKGRQVMAKPGEDSAKIPLNLTVRLSAILCLIRRLLSLESDYLLNAADRKAVSFGIRHRAY